MPRKKKEVKQAIHAEIKYEAEQMELLQPIYTAADCTVIIPTRKEPRLEWTVANIRRTAPDAEVIVIADGRQNTINGAVESPWRMPEGVGPCRDYGAELASNDVLVFCDAHMDFDEGWLEKLIAPINENPKALTCAQSKVLRPNMLDMRRANKVNRGANIVAVGKDGPLSVKWGDYQAGDEVPCVLGACYAIRRERYISELQRPWRNALGWGTSEQVISVVNWLAGGVNLLTDAMSGHVYRDNNEVPYELGEAFRLGQIYNRARLIGLLGISGAVLDRLHGGLSRSVPAGKRRLLQQSADLLGLVDDSAIRRSYVRTWDEYCERFGLRLDACTPAPARPNKPRPAARQSRFI